MNHPPSLCSNSTDAAEDVSIDAPTPYRHEAFCRRCARIHAFDRPMLDTSSQVHLRAGQLRRESWGPWACVGASYTVTVLTQDELGEHLRDEDDGVVILTSWLHRGVGHAPLVQVFSLWEIYEEMGKGGSWRCMSDVVLAAVRLVERTVRDQRWWDPRDPEEPLEGWHEVQQEVEEREYYEGDERRLDALESEPYAEDEARLAALEGREAPWYLLDEDDLLDP